MSLCNQARSIMLDQPPAGFIVIDGQAVDVAEPQPQLPPVTPPPDLDAIRRAAFAEGEARGRQAVEQMQREQRETLLRLEQELTAYQDNLERAVFEHTIDLSIKVAELILHRALPDKAMLCAVMREILQRITDLEQVRVRVHADDAAVLRQARENGELGPASRLEIHEDASLMPGDMVVENGFGCLDARLPQRLQLLREELIKRWRKSDADGTETPA